MAKAGYVGNQPVRESQAESYPGAWTGQEQYQETRADNWPKSIYEVERSVRINSADNAYFSRTPSTTGNTRTWTWSGWIKRSALSAGNKTVFMATTDNYVNDYTRFIFTNNNIYINHSSGLGGARQSVAVYRDTAAWMHVVIALDTTQATAASRLRFYVNGQEITAYSGADPGLNAEWWVNSSSATHFIGTAAGQEGFDGYLANIHLIDGLALTPSAFGVTDPETNEWMPKKYTNNYGYGVNGFWLKFADNSAATASTLGRDSSGNGNNWTPNNVQTGLKNYASLANWTTGNSVVQNASNAFDSNVATEATCNYTAVPANDWLQWNYPLRANTSLRFYIAGGPIDQIISINGLTGVNPGGSGRWLSLAEVFPGGSPSFPFNFSSIRVTPANSTRTGRLGAVEVDGTVLIANDESLNDILVDTPTSYGADTGLGGEVRGNYCTFNPLETYSTSFVTLSNGNLWARSTQSLSSPGGTIGTPSTGKWYWEISLAAVGGGTTPVVGFKTIGTSTPDYPGYQATSWGYRSSGLKQNNGTGSSPATSYGASWSTSDVIGVGIDADAGTATFYKNGISQGIAFTGLTGSFTPHVGGLGSGDDMTFALNAGQRPFAYAAPSGFKALCDTNLPTPVVAKPNTVFDTTLYTGNGSTQNITGLGFSPDLVWIKNRGVGTALHAVFDTVRGRPRLLYTNDTSAELNNANASQDLISFDSSGFTLGTNWDANVNANSNSYVAWAWDAGSSNATNTQGSITSTVRANASAGFSIVTYTGTGANATVGHGLGVSPSLLIIKSRGSARNWIAWHSAFGAAGSTDYLYLNSSLAKGGDGGDFWWNTTVPSSTVFSLGSSVAVNESTVNYVAYCFAPVAGYSSFGSYTPNDSTDGPFCFCGFRPRWVMIKASGGVGDWWVLDAARDTYNVARYYLLANSSGAEVDNTTAIDFLSNGFKIRTTSSGLNLSTRLSYVYVAFAESPFQYARAR